MGAKTSICATLILVFITFIFGTFVGLLCGYYGGLIDSIFMRLIDILLSVPQMVLAIAVAGALGGGMINAMIALGFTSWTLYARLAKSQTISAKQEDYVHAARLGGNSGTRIMLVHILPNIAGPLLVNATIQIGTLLIGFAGLSFLGLGVQVPQAEWGSMISESRAYVQLAPWTVLAPGSAIVLTALLFNYLGDTARDLLEVKG
ncbi:ABC transporter permease [Alkaliphilus metalliredigens]|nr:ABC transporter permease [Alkaliphilus metalliredigens]